MRILTASLAVALALAAAPAGAAGSGWTLDPSHTQIVVAVDHLGFSTVTAVFRDVAGEVAFDPDDVAATRVSLAIAAGSFDSFSAERDAFVRGENFLDVARHPTIAFVSTGLAPTGPDTAQIEGELTLLGVTRPVAFDARLNGVGPHPFDPGREVAGFTATGSIDRRDFGMDFAAPAIGAVLPVTVNVELVRRTDD